MMMMMMMHQQLQVTNVYLLCTKQSQLKSSLVTQYCNVSYSPNHSDFKRNKQMS